MGLLVSLKELRQKRKKDVFVGREKEIGIFTQMLDDHSSSSQPILNVVGVGGIGKSTLLNQYIETCKIKNIPYAVADGRDERIKAGVVNGRVVCNLPEILKIWRNQFEQIQKSKLFQEFDKDIERFSGVIQKYRKDGKSKSQRSELVEDFTANATGGLIGASIAGVPGVILGAALGSVAGKLVNAIGRTSQGLHDAGLSEEEIDFCLNIEEILANSFVLGVNRLVSQYGRIVIIIDTFEMVLSFQRWILNNLLDTNISADVCFVVAGREPLDSKLWHDWKHLIRTINLESLPSETVSEFLLEHKIRDKKVLEKVQQVSNGVPWAMNLLAENLAIMDGDWEAILAKGLPYEISSKMVERFLEQIKDNGERLVVQACAVPLSFDADLIETMMGDQFPGSSVWEKVMQYSFWGTSPSGRIFIIDPMREFIIDRLKIERPLTLDTWNAKARDYYRQIVSSSEERLTGYIWEYLYHYFLTDSEAHALFLPRREFIESIEISIPALDDVDKMLEVDNLTMGTDPEILYDEDRIRMYVKNDPSMFRIAVDKKSGRVAGYGFVIVPHDDWCRKFEAKEKPRIHLHQFLKMSEIGEFGDYLIDTITVINPRDRVTAAVLMRSIISILAIRPRKFYAQTVTEFGFTIVRKLQMNHLVTRYTANGSPIEGFYFCMYSDQHKSPLYEALEKYKPNVPREVVCKGCMVKECQYHSQYAESNLINHMGKLWKKAQDLI